MFLYDPQPAAIEYCQQQLKTADRMILWDIDDTLYDSEPIFFYKVNEFLQSYDEKFDPVSAEEAMMFSGHFEKVPRVKALLDRTHADFRHFCDRLFSNEQIHINIPVWRESLTLREKLISEGWCSLAYLTARPLVILATTARCLSRDGFCACPLLSSVGYRKERESSKLGFLIDHLFPYLKHNQKLLYFDDNIVDVQAIHAYQHPQLEVRVPIVPRNQAFRAKLEKQDIICGTFEELVTQCN